MFMDWFLYDKNLGHERVNELLFLLLQLRNYVFTYYSVQACATLKKRTVQRFSLSKSMKTTRGGCCFESIDRLIYF